MEQKRDGRSEQEEVTAFLTQVMRGSLPDREPTVSERIKAAEALGRRLAEADAQTAALMKLDEILEVLRGAAE